MIIRCWGARGSIPVSGKEYLKYGGDSTCIEVRTKDDEVIIIDAGTGIRRLGNRFLNEGRRKYNIIFTHSHWDHMLGFPFFKPIYLKKSQIKLYGFPTAQADMHRFLSKTMRPPFFPVCFKDLAANISFTKVYERDLHIGSAKISRIKLSHPNLGVGYRIEEDGKSFVFLTDNEFTFNHPGGLGYEDYLHFSRDADLLLHDSEYTEEEYKKTRGFGHSTYKDALKLAIGSNAKMFGLFHHNQDRSDDELDGIVKDCQQIILENNSGLKCFAAYPGMEIVL
ncbi:MAG: MBL fold metallo-hydrolase [Thermodesulfovibrionia bacterium]|nr:MBL fold metallo-hydrolase [Thermodesulfovibrionia bacterium]